MNVEETGEPKNCRYRYLFEYNGVTVDVVPIKTT